ncbi:MAG: transporter substrate-binding domain-containing protein [Pseudomonadota bacterium]
MKSLRPFTLLLTVACLPAMAQEVTVAWREKPPYHYTLDGVERGFLLERGKRIFRAAGVKARFVAEPQQRIWSNFKEGKGYYCSLGRYHKPERDAFAQYSHAIHTDPPQSLLASPEALERVRAHKTFASLLADKTLQLGLMEGGSYGPYLDGMIEKAGNVPTRRTVDSSTLLRMAGANRMAYTIADRYGYDYLKARDPQAAALTPVEMPDMSPGMRRFLVCSRDIPPEVMQKLNKAIDKFRFADKPPTAAELAE